MCFGAAAIPSLAGAWLSGDNPPGTLAGLTLSVVLLTVRTGTVSFQRLWRNPYARRAVCSRAGRVVEPPRLMGLE